jgi:ribosomal protein S18 acetylase RimI-like enzyme
MLVIKEAEDSRDIATARELFREYQGGLGVDLCFQSFDAELAALPGRYARPTGRLLLAAKGQSAVGVVALRALNRADCEMKRLYVRPAGRGLGVGRLLAAKLINEATIAGYQRMLLDTLPAMTQAQTLYRSLGFTEIAPYCENPIAGTLYMALDLLACSTERRE